jgi:hypothetical protein
MVLTPDLELGQLLDPALQLLDLLAKFLGLGIVARGEPVFQSLQSCFALFFIDLSLPDALHLFDIVHVRFGEFRHVESVVDLVAVDAQHALAVDARVLQRGQYLIVIPETSVAMRRSLHGAGLAVNGLVVVQPSNNTSEIKRDAMRSRTP